MRQTGAQLHCQYRADLCGLIAADPDLATHQNLFWYRVLALHVAVVQHVDAQLLIPLTSFLEHADDLAELLLADSRYQPDKVASILKESQTKWLPLTTPIYHWGDVDEGGFRIASTIAAVARGAGFFLQPYGMSPKDVPLNMRVKASTRTLERIHHFACAAGWPELGQAMREAGFVAEQEALERE